MVLFVRQIYYSPKRSYDIVPTPDSSHTVLYRGVSRLLRKDRPILSDIIYFLLRSEIYGQHLRIRIFLNYFKYKILSSQVFGLTPEPKPYVSLKVSFYLRFVPTEKFISL